MHDKIYPATAEFALMAGHDDIVELIQTWAAVEEGGGRDWVRGCIYNRTHEERERARVVEERARKARLKRNARAGWKRAKEGAEVRYMYLGRCFV